jgi:5-methylcytosine-specific restriction endonuclease McrA
MPGFHPRKGWTPGISLFRGEMTPAERKRAYRKAYYLAHREECQAQAKAWRAANLDRARELGRKAYWRDPAKSQAAGRVWRKNNPERVREQREKWTAANPEKLAAHYRKKGKRRRERLPEHLREMMRQWRTKNPEARAAQFQRRRALELNAPGAGVSTEQWVTVKADYSGLCAYCGTMPDKLQMDHIEPLSKGGAHDTENVAPACRSCNASKNNRTLLIWLALRAA